MIKPKVLIFSLAYFPFFGGAEIAVREITERLPEIDFEMITVNLDGRQSREELVGRILVYRLGRSKPAKYLFPWQAYYLAKKLHRQKSYRAIWAIMANQAGLAAWLFRKRFPQVKYLLTLQEGDSLWDIWLRTWFIRPWYKAIYRQERHQSGKIESQQARR